MSVWIYYDVCALINRGTLVLARVVINWREHRGAIFKFLIGHKCWRAAKRRVCFGFVRDYVGGELVGMRLTHKGRY